MDETQAPATLLGKLHDIAQQIAYIEKRGRNDHHHYSFAQAVDVIRPIRDLLLERHIMVLPSAHGVEHLAYGSKGGHLTTVTLSYRFYDIETGETADVPWVGVGADTGGDKGVYKAFTGGLKYMLLTTFLVPTSDDPERDRLTEASEPPAPAQHKDDARPAATTIPRDRAALILKQAIDVGMAKIDLDAEPGTPPEYHPAFKAKLGIHGVAKIGMLNVDQAEEVEAWLRHEGQQRQATA